MQSRILVVMLAVSLLWSLSGTATAGVLGYSMDRADKGFERKADAEPSAAVVAVDGLIARPLGLATTIAGTGLFLVTLPFSASSGSVHEAARGMIGKPGGWTFVRPMGRGDARFEEQGVFGR
ncbi:MAG: hypothetical protein NTY36_11040 [Deltaproteobacteria bacterium]|nr:hypothetical protein [Deltaproteobacteria bacterium]